MHGTGESENEQKLYDMSDYVKYVLKYQCFLLVFCYFAGKNGDKYECNRNSQHRVVRH